MGLQRGNTLHANGRWTSTKVGLEYGILGSVSFVVTRTALHLDRLDPGVWHGYHEILHREPSDVARMELRFKLGRPAHLIAIPRHDGDRFEAVRVSSDPGFPSACLAGDAEGGFTVNGPLGTGPLDDGWHRLALVREGSRWQVRLDGETIGACDARIEGPARFGLRGSAERKTWFDDVVVEDADGTTVREDFARREGAAGWFAGALAVLLLLYAGVALASRRRGAVHSALAATHVAVLPSLLMVWAVDTFYLGRVHPDRIDFDRYPYENRIEYESAVRRRLASSPQGPPPPGVRRVLLVGTSQTWGSGARTEAETWGARLEAGLQGQAADGERFEVIDTGIPGLQARHLVPLFEDEWLSLEPELVIVNLSNNDRDLDAFRSALERLAGLCAERGIRAVFVPEANTVEARGEKGLRGLEARHDVVRDVAARWAIPVVETHGPMAERNDEGFLWWDRVHLTSFGHRMLAGLLLDAPDALLGAPPPTPPE